VAVAPGSAAERAGLRPSDVVVAINGHTVHSSVDLRNQLGLIPVREEFELKVQREGRERPVKVIMDAAPPRAGGGHAVGELAGASVVGGGRRNGFTAEGVGIAAVEQGSVAWNHGLRAGDVIVGVNRRKVNSVTELEAALNTKSKPTQLNVVRGDFLLTLVVRR